MVFLAYSCPFSSVWHFFLNMVSFAGEIAFAICSGPSFVFILSRPYYDSGFFEF